MKQLVLLVSVLLLAGCGGSSSGGNQETSATPGGNGSGASGSDAWLIPEDEVLDGGPGKDGIPALDNPSFVAAAEADYLEDSDLVVGVKRNGEIKAYPHPILDWHEIVNDRFDGEPLTINYCPLTGSAMLWQGSTEASNPTFGVSGLLFNSNLILYDRETDSYWSQMQARVVRGARAGEEAERLPVVETTWGNWRDMYPDTLVLSTDTGFSRDYNRYPYGSFRTDNNLIFPVTEMDDRLHRKTRVLGVRDGDYSKVYQIDRFANEVEVINEVNQGYVVVGSSERNFAMAYSAILDDGTQLTFEAIQNDALVMEDNEGNRWDLFGVAQEGPRAGEKLDSLFSYTAYWFAWAAFFPGAEIHFQ